MLTGITIMLFKFGSFPLSNASFFQCEENVWDKIFDVNLKSAFLLTKEIVPHLISRKGGSIVYISSIAGVNPMPVIISTMDF